MIHIKTTQKIALLIAFCVLAACSSDTSEQNAPWEIQEIEQEPGENPGLHPQPVELLDRPVSVEACSPHFVEGPVWQLVANQEAALEESEWIATFTTSKWKLFQDSGVPPDPSLGSHELPIDYSSQISELDNTLAELDIEVLHSHYDRTLIVAGTPANILEAVKTSCHILIMDLTGFHCDCAPEQCQAARTCDFNRAYLYDLINHNDYAQVTSFVRTYSGCFGDTFRDDTYGSPTQTDLRGVQWSLHRATSWNESSCALPDQQ